MKLLSPISSHQTANYPPATRAFTLTELMTVVAIFLLLVGAAVSSQVFGLRMYRISETKLAVAADARMALNRIRDEIRSAKLLSVGNGDSSSFTSVLDKASHTGNALRIYPTTDTNNYVYYYLDENSACLKRMVSGSQRAQILAEGVTNHFVFQAENFQGRVVTNYQNNQVIRIFLQFNRWEFPTGQAGNNGLYEYYQLETRVARRATE